MTHKVHWAEVIAGGVLLFAGVADAEITAPAALLLIAHGFGAIK